MRKLSIICILSNPGSWGSPWVEWGGETRALEVLARMHRMGALIWSLETTPSASQRRNARYHVHTAKLLVRRPGAIAAAVNAVGIWIDFALTAVKLRSGVDIVLAPTSNLTDIGPAWLISKIARKPLAVVYQLVLDATTVREKYRVLRRDLGRVSSCIRTLGFLTSLRLARDATAILCISIPVRDKLLQAGLMANRTFLTSMGVNMDAIGKTPELSKEFDGVYLGRVERAKGIEDLITAWGIVAEKLPHSRLVIIGTGPFVSKAQKLATAAGLDKNIEFKGYVEGEAKYKLLKQSKLLVFPSHSEGFGLTVAEAMACGIPAICYDTVASIFANCKSIVSVPKGDVREFGQTVVRLLLNSSARERLGSLARSESQQFRWDLVTQIDYSVLTSISRRD